MSATANPLELLYEQDETAWLDAMAKLAAAGRASEMDFLHLAEFLADMAGSERREVHSRLTVLLAHLLKWTLQPAKRSNSWRATIREQRVQLRLLLESGTLRRHAEEILARAYADARQIAADETGLNADAIPADFEYDVDDVLNRELDSHR